MRFQLSTLLIAALSATPALAGQKVAAVWSGSTFSTVGGTNGFDTSFWLRNSDNDVITSYGGLDHPLPCTLPGSEFQLEKGCFGASWYSFRCISNQIGTPQSCEVMGPDGQSVGKGKGGEKTEFFGVGIANGGECVVEFELVDGIDCGADVDGFVSHDTDWHH